MDTYTLDQALTLVANADSYTFPTIERIPGTDNYTVTDGLMIDLESCDITVYWTHEDGPELPKNLIDYSRVHEPCERYDNAGHIRYNLPNAIDVIEAGEPVTFMWAVVDAHCECPIDVDYCECNPNVGWMMLAADGAITRNR